MKTNIKMRVTPEQNKQIQQIVGDIDKALDGEPYLYLDDTNHLSFSYIGEECLFDRHNYEEVDADLFIRTNGTCEEQDPLEPIGYGILDKEEKESKMNIDDTLKQRGEVYGSFEAQAECVGFIIQACDECAKATGYKRGLDKKQMASIAYIAIKLARFAVNPNHADTTHDLVGYTKLIDEMYQAKGETK